MKDRTTFQEWRNVETENPICKRMKSAQLECRSTISGGTNIAIISGTAGVGKNVAVRTALKEAGVQALMCNPTTYQDFLKAVSTAQRDGKALWLDEADYVFGSLRMINILKSAVGPKSERVYNGRNINVPRGIFLTTNSDLADLSWMKAAGRPHLRALFDRERPIVIAGSVLELWEYAVFLAVTTPMTQSDDDGDGIPLNTAQRAIDWFTQNVHRLENPSPRTLYRVADMLHRSEKVGANLHPDQVLEKLEAMKVRESATRPPLTPDLRAIMATRPKYSREKIDA